MSIYSRIREAFGSSTSSAVLTEMNLPLGSWHDAFNDDGLPQLAYAREDSRPTGFEFVREELVQVPVGKEGTTSALLYMPEKFVAAIILTHDPITNVHCGSNRVIARMLHLMGFATLLMDVDSPQVESSEPKIDRLQDPVFFAKRLLSAANWLSKRPCAEGLPLGYVGTGSAAESALVASARRPDLCRAVVGVAWKPETHRVDASQVTVPTLLIAGGGDADMARLNSRILGSIAAQEKDLELIPGATHLFEAPGTLEAAAIRTGKWFERHLIRAITTPQQEMLAKASWP